MALKQSDMEQFVRLISNIGNDITISIARSFERLEERIDAAESRLYSRLSDVEDKIEALRTDVKLDAF